MDRLKLIISLAVVSYAVLYCQLANAQTFQENNDVLTTAQVNKNTAIIFGFEDINNAKIDSIKSEKTKQSGFMTAMALAKTTYKIARTNIKGFGAESVYYRMIAKKSLAIMELTPKLYDAIKDSKLPGKARMMLAMPGFITECYSCVNDFVNICNNAKVENPFKKKDKEKNDSVPSFDLSSIEGLDEHSTSTEATGDGANLLDRNERLKIAVNVVTHLNSIYTRMWRMYYYLKSYSWSQLAAFLDPQTYYSFYYGKSITNDMIRKWERLKD